MKNIFNLMSESFSLSQDGGFRASDKLMKRVNELRKEVIIKGPDACAHAGWGNSGSGGDGGCRNSGWTS